MMAAMSSWVWFYICPNDMYWQKCNQQPPYVVTCSQAGAETPLQQLSVRRPVIRYILTASFTSFHDLHILLYIPDITGRVRMQGQAVWRMQTLMSAACEWDQPCDLQAGQRLEHTRQTTSSCYNIHRCSSFVAEMCFLFTFSLRL